MNKLSKAYNRATCELDALVRKTRAIHHGAVDELEAAAAENSKWNRPIPEYDYQGRAAQATARAVYEGKKKDCFRTVTGAWDSFDMQAKEIRAELAAAVADASTLNAKDVDANAVTLLNSGLMTAKDYQRMARDYAENSTVLSLLRASATKYCDGLRDDGGQGNATEIVNTRHVIETAKTSGEMELTAFDNLLEGARSLAGRVPGGFRETSRVFSKTALDSWGVLSAGLIGEDEGEGSEDE